MWLRKNGRKKKKKRNKKKKKGCCVGQKTKDKLTSHVYINPIKKLKRVLCWWF